jgi:hypothetical protein
MSISQLSAGTQAVCLRFAHVHTMYGVACSVGIPCRLVGCLWGLGWSSGCCSHNCWSVHGVPCAQSALLWVAGRAGSVQHGALCDRHRVALPHVCAGLPAQSCRHTGCQPHCMPFWSAAQQHSVTWQCWEQALRLFSSSCMLACAWLVGVALVVWLVVRALLRAWQCRGSSLCTHTIVWWLGTCVHGSCVHGLMAARACPG